MVKKIMPLGSKNSRRDQVKKVTLTIMRLPQAPYILLAKEPVRIHIQVQLQLAIRLPLNTTITQNSYRIFLIK